MDDVRVELGEVAADMCRDGERKAIFGAPRDRHGGDADQVASRLESRLRHCRRIDADLEPLAEEIADQAIERLVGAIPHIIVIAREEGDAEVSRLHGAGCRELSVSVKSMVAKVGMPPIARADARLFVLGSLPGDASLAAQHYYAHPTNQFWLLLGGAIGEELQPLGYEQRLERLAARKIGLWDVIASATRPGSLD